MAGAIRHSMRRLTSPHATILGCVLLFLQMNLQAVSLKELRNVDDLTPQKFASFFSKFDYCFRAEVQTPEVFLETESGDCDDFSTLAAKVLREKGYTTRLVAVRMPSMVHVVCYVEETRSYLDYNYRTFLRKTVRSGNSLEEIAAKVAKSFGEDWTSASEFTYESREKRLVATVVDAKDAFAVSSWRKSQPRPKLISLLPR